MRNREINTKTAIKVVIFNGLFLNVAKSFDNMQQKMFAKFFGYLNRSLRGATKQCITWGREIIKIMEKIYCLADSYIKVAKNFHNYLKYKVFLIMLIFDGVLHTTILRTRNLKAIWNAVLGKVCLLIVWNIDDYQKKCSFSIFDIFVGVEQRDW